MEEEIRKRLEATLEKYDVSLQMSWNNDPEKLAQLSVCIANLTYALTDYMETRAEIESEDWKP